MNQRTDRPLVQAVAALLEWLDHVAEWQQGMYEWGRAATHDLSEIDRRVGRLEQIAGVPGGPVLETLYPPPRPPGPPKMEEYTNFRA